MHGRTVKLLATIGIGLAVVGFIIYSAMQNSTGQQDADDLIADWKQDAARKKLLSKRIGLHGFVEPGSIKEEVIGQKTHRTFYVAMNDARVMVRHDGPKPDTFRDGAEVVAKGRLIEENGLPVFMANDLMAKCPSKYEGDSPQGLAGAGGKRPVFEN